MMHPVRSVLPCLAGLFVALAGCTQAPLTSMGSSSSAEVDAALRTSSGAATSGQGVLPTPGVLSEEDWSFGVRSGKVIRTAHYRIFTTTQNEVLRDRMPLFLEHAIAHYRSVVVELPLPPQKLDTYLMNSRPQWEEISKRLLGAGFQGVQHIERGGFASRGLGVYFDIGLYDTLAIAAHEGWHQYVQRTFRDPIPVWLDEGLATYMEGHSWSGQTPVFRPWQNLERFDALRNGVAEGRLIPLSTLLSARPGDLLAEDPQQGLLYYAQVWALAHYLIEGESGSRKPGLERLLNDAVTGKLRETLVGMLGAREAAIAIGSRSGDALIRAYITTDLADFEAGYTTYLKRITASGARQSIAGGRSPL